MRGRLIHHDGTIEEVPKAAGRRFIRAEFTRQAGNVADLTEIYLVWEDGFPRVIPKWDRRHPNYDPSLLRERIYELESIDGDVMVYRESVP